MVNPFDLEQTSLVHLASGVVATDAVKQDLLGAKSIGQERFLTFVKDNIVSESPDVFATIKKAKLKTFSSDMKRLSVPTSKGKEVSLRSSRNLCARLLLLASSRSIDMREVLCYQLGPYPLSLATIDGSRTKTVKASLMHLLEEQAPECVVNKVPANSALIIDAMALLQATRVPSTFGEISHVLLSQMLSLAQYHNVSRVDFVADRYPEISIKNDERSNRAAGGSTRVSLYGKNQSTPAQWKKFLSNGENKESLICFIVDCWKELKSEDLLGVTLYATSGRTCFKFVPCTVSDVVEAVVVSELESDHEEADTRVLLHAKHASDSGYENVVIKSPDTDVFALMVGMQKVFSASLFFLTGAKNKARIIAVRNVCSKFSPDTCDSVIGFHAFTG